MNIDFHIHTKYSKCSNLNPAEAVRIAEKRGLNVIALINHDIKPIRFKGSSKVKVLRGVEVSSKEGHILIINTSHEFKKGLNAQEVINEARKDKNCLIIIPHPFDVTRKGVGRALYELNGYHAIEVNARCLFNKFNDEARSFAKEFNVPLIAGSDAHFIDEIGNAKTVIKSRTINEAFKLIKQGKTHCYIKKRSFINKLKPFIKSMLRPQ